MEKKKSDQKPLANEEEELPLPSKSEIIRDTSDYSGHGNKERDITAGKHNPVIEKPTKSFSIKGIISEEKKLIQNDAKQVDGSELTNDGSAVEELNPTNFDKAWREFTDNLKGDGTRIISMFKSVRTEIENDQNIKIHLSNAAQKDLFVQNYKQKLIGFLNRRFGSKEIDIETVVDLSETNEILYSDEQKFNYLVSKYPELKDFKKTFNLDIT